MEQRGFMRAIGSITRQDWQAVLRRPLMSQEELTRRITTAGQRSRQLGAVTLAHAR
jgi:hypothetical protein